MEVSTSQLNGFVIQNQVRNHVLAYRRNFFSRYFAKFELNIDQLQVNRLDFKSPSQVLSPAEHVCVRGCPLFLKSAALGDNLVIAWLY